MSLFRRPKKTVQRRVFSVENDESDSENDTGESKKIAQSNLNSGVTSKQDRSKTSMEKNLKNAKPKKPSLLSFEDEEEGEVFQVKKSSHSKKVMKQLDKERKKRKNKNVSSSTDNKNGNSIKSFSQISEEDKPKPSVEILKGNATEVILDDFVLRVKNVEPDPVILNGRAALCAGRNDMSSEDEEENDSKNRHRFVKPDNFKTVLESGEIPDAAMIHAARKSRQKAREQGEYIPIEEKQPDNQKGRFIKDDDDDGSDNERVDMSAINGSKEKAERREQFYSVQEEYDESDPEINEWENQQLRKGVTGAQIVSAQQESAIYSQYLTKQIMDHATNESNSNILKQMRGKTTIEKAETNDNKQKTSICRLRMPKEVVSKFAESLAQLKISHAKHISDIQQINKDTKMLVEENIQCEEAAPVAAEKYRYYQELRGYLTDLVECLDEKVPQIIELEKRAIAIMSKQASYLIKRRHQDVRDQAQEISKSGKPGAARKMLDDEDRVRRAADREGRRTRRRQIREKMDINNAHMDGMSSDDEIHQDHEAALQKNQLEQIVQEANSLYADTTVEFSEMSALLERFENWRKKYIKTYQDIYFSLCLPKILGPMIRIYLITWNPLLENCQDIERMDWYKTAIKYGWTSTETENSLYIDPDSQLIPILIEKIILPKLTEIIETCWDPLSTTQALRLVGLIGRLGREYPTLKSTSKYLQTLFLTVIQKMKLSLENDVFIPIYSKHLQEASRSSFFQRQFSSALKLFRNFLSWQGILSDQVLKELAITSLLNRYFLPALRVCNPIDATSKAYIIVNTMPRVWLQKETGIVTNLDLFIQFLKYTTSQLDKRNPLHMDSIEKLTQILNSLHASS